MQTGSVGTGKGENMTLDETIDRIESDLFEIDMIDMQSAADKEVTTYHD